MKGINLLTAALAVLLIVTTGCADRRTIDGVTYDTYGVLNKDEKKNEAVQYEVVWGNVVWGSILFSTVIAPVYFFGFSLWEPVGKKSAVRGQVSE